MIHIRVDDEADNSKRKFACGIGPTLPPGDQFFYQSETYWHHRVDCPNCNPKPRQLGTPFSELTRARFVAIAHSWGFE